MEAAEDLRHITIQSIPWMEEATRAPIIHEIQRKAEGRPEDDGKRRKSRTRHPG